MVIQIKDNLFAVEVSKGSYTNDIILEDVVFYVCKNNATVLSGLPKGNYTVLGDSSVNFDCEPFVEKVKTAYGVQGYKIYGDENYCTVSKYHSFRTLLQSKGCNFTDNNIYKIVKKHRKLKTS